MNQSLETTKRLPVKIQLDKNSQTYTVNFKHPLHILSHNPRGICTAKNGTLTLLEIKSYINDNSFENDDCILINTLNFDDLILEYRNDYRESATIPFYYVGVLITDKHEGREPALNAIKVAKYNRDVIEDSSSLYRALGLNFNDLSSHDKTIYRCHNCGNIVEWNGKEFLSTIKSYKISLFENFGNAMFIETVKGRCCFP